MIHIDTDRCIGCGSCVDVCLTGALSLVGGIAHIEQKLCDACLACLDECPERAIQTIEAVPVHAASPASASRVYPVTATFDLEEAIPMLHEDIREAASGEHRGYGRGHGRGRRRGCRQGDGEGHGHGEGHGQGRGHGHTEGYGRGRGEGRGWRRRRHYEAEEVDRDAGPETESTTLEGEIARLKAQTIQMQEALADISDRLAALERE